MNGAKQNHEEGQHREYSVNTSSCTDKIKVKVFGQGYYPICKRCHSDRSK